MITRMMLASVLAVGASLFAGCGQTDCPDSITVGESCSAGSGLFCDYAGSTCMCESGKWQCSGPDIHDVIRDFSMPRDLTSSD